MDRRERVSNSVETFQAAFKGLISQTWTAMPGIIESFNASTMTCRLQLGINDRIPTTSKGIISTTLPLLVDCPVYFPSGGNCTLTFPIAPGDECLVVFASRCIDSWWQSGGVQESAEVRA